MATRSRKNVRRKVGSTESSAKKVVVSKKPEPRRKSSQRIQVSEGSTLNKSAAREVSPVILDDGTTSIKRRIRDRGKKKKAKKAREVRIQQLMNLDAQLAVTREEAEAMDLAADVAFAKAYPRANHS